LEQPRMDATRAGNSPLEGIGSIVDNRHYTHPDKVAALG